MAISPDNIRALWNVSARAYANYVAQFDMHQKTARGLVDLAGIGAGETVLDFGAGPGTATKEIVKAVGPEGRVVAYDISDEMLKHAAVQMNFDPAVKFVRGDTDEAGDKLAGFRFSSAVFSNSFFQLPAKAELIRTLRVFCPSPFKMSFSLYETVYDEPSHVRKVESDEFFGNILEVAGERGYKYGSRQERYDKLNFAALCGIFTPSGMRIDQPQVLEFDRSFDERLAFFKIPAILYEILPGVPIEEAGSIVEEAAARTKARVSQKRIVYLFKAYTVSSDPEVCACLPTGRLRITSGLILRPLDPYNLPY